MPCPSSSSQTTPSLNNPYDGSRDAFARLRVSEPFTLLDAHNIYRPSDKFFSNVIGTGNVSYLSTESAMLLSTGSSGTAIRQTNKVFAYQPGKSLLVVMTFCITAGTGTHRMGFFNQNDGLFLEYSSGAAYFAKRNQGSDTKVIQSSWNVDKLDGNGPSKLVLDLTKAQILWFDLEWLGVGNVRQGFIINGQLIPCHIWYHANYLTGVYMTSAMLPIRYEVTGTSASLKSICSTVISEGGYNPNPLTYTIGRSAPLVNLGSAGTIVPLISLRLKSDRLYGYVTLKHIELFNSSSSDGIQWYINYGTTLSTPSWTDHPNSNLVQYDITSASMSGGRTIVGGFIDRSGSAQFDITSIDFRIGQSDIGVSEVLTLAAAGLANNLSAAARLVWFEL